MRILVIHNVEWNNTTASGNTLSNWFEEWDECIFYNIYNRPFSPSNKVCHHYFRITPFDLLKIDTSSIGEEFIAEFSEKKNSDSEIEKRDNFRRKLFKKTRKLNMRYLFNITDKLYAKVKWKNKRYNKFIEDANPELIFTFGVGDTFVYENIRYIKSKMPNVKFAMAIVDDVYGNYSKSKSSRSRRCLSQFTWMMENADLIYAITPMLIQHYEQLFNKKIKLLQKGCLIQPPRTTVNSPLKIVYAGNLAYGRDDTICAIAKVIDKLNQSKLQLTLDIYTGTSLPEDKENNISCKKGVTIHNRLSYEEIMNIMHLSDIVLHVESFSLKEMEKIRFSFSTKITDCLQSGSTMMVIGPKGIASVEETRIMPGAIVIDNLNEIEERLNNLLQNTMKLIECSKILNTFAKEKYDINVVRQNLRKDLFELTQH